MGVASKAVYLMMVKKDMRQKDLAAAVGEDPRQLNQQLRKTADICLERFCRYADAAGFDVVIVDRATGAVEKLECSKKNL